MTTPESTRFERLQQRYRTNDLPCDRDLPPPKIIALAEERVRTAGVARSTLGLSRS